MFPSISYQFGAQEKGNIDKGSLFKDKKATTESSPQYLCSSQTIDNKLNNNIIV